MVQVYVKNLDRLQDQFDTWVDQVEQSTADAANGMAVELFNALLQNSPQWSGDFVGNWQYQINNITPYFNELNLLDHRSYHKDVFRRGDMPAIRYAQSMNKGRDSMYKLGDTFYLHNSAVHTEPYAQKIEAGSINFRRDVGNEGRVIYRSLMDVAPKYTHITEAHVNKLRKKKL